MFWNRNRPTPQGRFTTLINTLATVSTTCRFATIRGLWLPALLALVYGCSRSEGARSPDEARYVLFAGLDTSASDRANLGVNVLKSWEAVKQLPANETWLTLGRADSTFAEAYDDLLPSTKNRYIETVVPPLQADAEHPGTTFEPFWRLVTERASTVKGRLAVVLFSDGQGDAMSAADHAKVRSYAVTLAKHQTLVVVAIVGADTGTWESLRADLAPLGSKLRFFSREDRNLSVIGSLLQGGRP